MAVVGIGVDLVPVARIAAWLERYDAATLGLVFTDAELAAARCVARPERHLARCFAAKEAAAKALGGDLDGLAWTDIDVRAGGPEETLSLAGPSRALAKARGIARWRAATSAGPALAVASVVAESAA